MVSIQLTIAKGAQAGAQALFEQPEVLIGRTEDNDVVLLQGGVSRRHARVFIEAGGAWAEDLGSANGTLVNGQRLDQPRRLREGDEITVGSVVLRVALPEDLEASEVSATNILGDNAGAAVEEPSEVSGTSTHGDPRGYEDDDGDGATAPLPPAAVSAPLGPLPRARRTQSRSEPDDAPPAVREPAVREPPVRAEPRRRTPPPPRAPEPPSEVSEVSEVSAVEQDGTLPIGADEVAAAMDAAATRLNPMGTPAARARKTALPVEAPIEVAATRLTDLGAASAEAIASAVSGGGGVAGGEEIERAQTRMLELPIEARAADVKRKLRSIDASQPEAASALALVREGQREGPSALAKAGPAAPVRGIPRGNLGKMDAVDRVRLKRELSETMGGQLRLWWMGLDAGPKRITLGVLAVLLIGTVGALWYVFRPTGSEHLLPTGPEPVALGSTPAEGSFGWGENVTWPNPDQKAFNFEFVSPTRVVAVLHFEAADIAPDEVAISLNGMELGAVEADTAGVRDREHEWVLPLLQLRSGERNQVIFDNRNNPPGRQTWSIRSPWVEIIPVPELSDRQLIAAAREHANRGADFVDKREVGSDNLFKAWKAYREAWITLEPLTEHPALYHDVRLRMNQLKNEMDTLCGTLLLDFQRAIELNQRRKARASLQDVVRHFPTPEHRCHNQAMARYNEYSL